MFVNSTPLQVVGIVPNRVNMADGEAATGGLEHHYKEEVGWPASLFRPSSKDLNTLV